MIFRQRLQESVGVLVSEDWLAECVAANNTSANTNNGPPTAEEEAVLEQLLHHDLRDVVEPGRPSAAATALRRAVDQSKLQQQQQPSPLQHGSGVVVKLPEGFRLLVQVENCSNMAVNAEKRLAVDAGAGALHHSTLRCLKLAFSDGYDHGQQEEETYCFTAMEVTRIPDLTATNAAAGIKVLLRGPMTIRNGICGWTADNAIVLGGYVEELQQYQQQSLQRERQRVGHGVDPTVKALIWMNNGEHEDNENNNNDQGTRWTIVST
jgi:RecQ mediated genome instability protein